MISVLDNLCGAAIGRDDFDWPAVMAQGDALIMKCCATIS